MKYLYRNNNINLRILRNTTIRRDFCPTPFKKRICKLTRKFTKVYIISEMKLLPSYQTTKSPKPATVNITFAFTVEDES